MDGCQGGEKMKLASIDIGTNTVLLLVAEISSGKLQVIREEQRIPRLGEGVDHNRNLSPKAVSRVIRALDDYRTILNRDYPEAGEPRVTATSAVRDAANRAEFTDRVEAETGFRVDVLTGTEEALYTFRGACSVLDEIDGAVAVVDIGGGSTEIAWGSAESGLVDRYSYDMGCVRFTERYLNYNPPGCDQIEKCRKSADKILDEYSFSFPGETTLIGVAGTVTSLAYMELGIDTYDSTQITGTTVKLDTLRTRIDRIRNITSDELEKQYPVVMEGRADIFLAGLLILERIMTVFGFERLTASTGGIRHGTVLEMAAR